MDKRYRILYWTAASFLLNDSINYQFAWEPRLAGFICVRKSNNCGL